jgi:uncharacterized membrane protein YdjX (TVP38/TMEM64 family)
MRTTGSHWRRAALIVGVIVAGVIVARAFGFAAYLRFENLSRLTETIEGYGVLGPVIYIAAYVLGVVFFVPGLPMTLLGGLAFGPVRGAAYVWVAATIGAALAFLVARYGLRGLVEGWVERNARLTRMDEAVARDGWRIVMITRLVPLFPFNLQNYAYGVTRIGFWSYVTTSAVCMIPATVAYTFAGGALSHGGDLRWTLGYLAVAGVLIVLVSLIPRYLERRNRAAGALLRMAILLPVLAALGAGPPLLQAGDAAYATPTFPIFVKGNGFAPFSPGVVDLGSLTPSVVYIYAVMPINPVWVRDERKRKRPARTQRCMLGWSNGHPALSLEAGGAS